MFDIAIFIIILIVYSQVVYHLIGGLTDWTMQRYRKDLEKRNKEKKNGDS